MAAALRPSRWRAALLAAALAACLAGPACRAETATGLADFRASRFAEAMTAWQAAAAAGDPMGALYVGVLYDVGLGVQQDYASASAWYQRAYGLGSAAAAFNLGVLYDAGLGVATDRAEAARWYRRAADRGSARAEYNLALLCEAGDGVPADRHAALLLFRSAAAHGITAALAHLRALGEGAPPVRHVTVDPAQFEFEQAQRLLLARGAGEASSAATLLRSAAEKGNPLAEYDLAYCYEHGIGVVQDPARAFEWYQRAAGHAAVNPVQDLALAGLRSVQQRMAEAKLQQSEAHRAAERTSH